MFELFFRLFLPVAYHFAIGKTSTNGQFPSQLLLDYRSFVYATLHLATTPWATLSLIRGDSIRELWIPQLKVTHNLSKFASHNNSPFQKFGHVVNWQVCVLYNLQLDIQLVQGIYVCIWELFGGLILLLVDSTRKKKRY